MVSCKLTDEELIALAQQTKEEDTESFDVGYFQERFNIIDGNHPVLIAHLYTFYEQWAFNPISCSIFVDVLKLNKKDSDYIYIDKDKTELDLDKLVGAYVKNYRKKQKEKRFRKISSSKPKVKR